MNASLGFHSAVGENVYRSWTVAYYFDTELTSLIVEVDNECK